MPGVAKDLDGRLGEVVEIADEFWMFQFQCSSELIRLSDYLKNLIMMSSFAFKSLPNNDLMRLNVQN